MELSSSLGDSGRSRRMLCMRSRFMDMAGARGVQVRDAAGSDSYL